MKLLEACLQSLDRNDWNRMATTDNLEGFVAKKVTRSFLALARDKSWKEIEEGRGEILKTIYPNRKITGANWELLKSEVLQDIERFWVYGLIDQDPIRHRHLLIQAYEVKGLHKNLRTHLNRYGEDIESAKASTENLENGFQLESMRYSYLSEVRREKDLNISELMTSADKAFVVRKLKLCCYALSHQQVIQEDYELTLLDEVLLLASSRGWLEDSLVKSFFHAIQMFRSDQDERLGHYKELRRTLYANFDDIGQEDLRDLTVLGINYSIMKYRAGDEGMSAELLEWYEFGINSGALLSNQQVSPYTYRNAATVALRADRLEWARTFTQDYKSLLPEQVQDDLYDFNMGRIYYHQGAYDRARDHLFNLNFEDTLLYLAARTLLLKIYFHIREWQLLDFTTDGLSAYVRRKKIAVSHRHNYLRFAKYMKALSRTLQGNPDNREARCNKLLDQILRDRAFPEKNWFLSQLNKYNSI